MWPVFIAATIFDAVIGHIRPIAGDSESVAAADRSPGLRSTCSRCCSCPRPLGALLRRRRRDLPAFVARNYAGTTVVVAVTIRAVRRRPRASRHGRFRPGGDARRGSRRGVDRRPCAAELQHNIPLSNTFAIQPGSLYRTCVPGSHGERSYYVMVRTQLPFAQSVSFDGSEPNSIFSEGTN